MATTLAFVGAGMLGQAFAALLARDGQAVTVLATPGSAARLLAAGEIRLRGAVELAVSVAPAPAPAGVVGLATDPAILPAGAGLIFTTKGHQLAGAVEAVRAAWPGPDDRAAWVAGVQNGVAKDDVLTEAFGAARVVGAATILGGSRDDDGRVTVGSLGMTYLGNFAGGAGERAASTVERLQAAGVPAIVPDDIRSVIWSKACNAAGVFGVSALTRAPSALIFHDPDLLRAYLILIRETAAIGTALGIAVGDYPQFPPIRTYVERPTEATLAAHAGSPRPPQTAALPSMTQDLVAGRLMEVEGVFGDLVARAGQVGVAAPALTLVRDLLRGVDRMQRAG